MKKIMILCMGVFFMNAHTQTLPASETSTLDGKLINIDKSSVTSGILYQRSPAYTALYDFNKTTDFNIASASFFEQSLTDLYYGSNKTKFTDYLGLRQLTVANKYKDNVVDVGIINTPFHILFYDEDGQNNGGLSFNASTNLFVKNNNGKPAFLEVYNTIIAPLKKEAKGTSITFNFKNNLNFFNGSKPIKSLYADLGDGVSRMVTGDGLFKPISFTANYTNSGTKKLKFDIVYMDNTILTTYGSIYFQYVAPASRESAAKATLCNGEALASDFSIKSDTEFKGYDEPFAFKGKFDYRVLYRKDGTDKKIRKPIIVVDGFDPGDKRKIFGCEMTDYKPGETFSIEDMMTYKAEVNGEEIRGFLIDSLRAKGYDVTIVNHPKYCVSNSAPYDVVDCKTATNFKEVDGGADYIERNALTLATLIKKLNTELKDNGSTEKLAIVGPSMGGQTSRYALALLEKQGIDHNTRLWISVDSPHLGANIPLGDQALLNLAATTGHSASAADFYNGQLGSPAAKQQLIESHLDNPDHHHVNYNNLNGRTISQGFSSNSGHPFFQQHYNNQFNNGLPNSKGYPVNLRKIALVNGSLSGNTIGGDNEMVLNLRAFKKIQIKLPFGATWTFTTHLGSLESYFMPTINTGEKRIARLKAFPDDRTTVARNINSRGNMDTVPGGWFPAQNEIAKFVIGKSPSEGVRGSFWQFTGDNIGYWFANDFLNHNGESPSYWELRNFRPNHSFIPTFSALGIKNPDRNWAENLQRNLVCTGETPFDSYYGSSENTQHTSFTEESVKWLMKELDGQEQAPWFPIKADAFQGTDRLCLNQTAIYSFPDPCKLPSNVTWSVSPNLQIISFTDYAVNVKALYQGQGTITATFQNEQTFTKTVHMGGPVSYMGNCNPYDATCTVNNYVLSDSKPNCITFETVGTDSSTIYNTDYEWEKVSGNFTFLSSGYPNCLEYPNVSNSGTKSTGKLAVISPVSWGSAPVIVKVRAKSSCGWGPWQNLFFYKPNSVITDLENPELFVISPNPANDFINISLVNQNNTPASKNSIQAEIYNSLGNKQKSVKLNNNKGTMSVNGLLQGVYTLKIIYDDKVESHQVIIK